MENATHSLTSSNPALCQIIAQQIARNPDQRIPFAEFMDLALYHPLHGYYAGGKPRIGAQGDFVTSPYLGADYGELLAVQLVEMWHVLGCPVPFTIVEMGAGQGLLVRDVLQYLHRCHFDCFEAVQYRVIEKSVAVVVEQQRKFAAIAKRWSKLQWLTWDDIPPDSIVGCYFSNELIDAFPVHQVMVQDGRLQEVYVTVKPTSDSRVEHTSNPSIQRLGEEFVEVVGDLSNPKLLDYLEQLGVDITAPAYPNGYRTEINLAALDWLANVSERLQRGYILTIDYGYPAQRYYSPARSEGTLQCYYQQGHHSNPYVYIGHQDITAHVNFTALERQGEQYGLQTIGFTQQALFLMALGLGDRLSALSNPDPDLNWTVTDVLQRREALHALIDPMGLGNFGVLVQSKGLSSTEAAHPLQGFSTPPFNMMF